ncbi:hypothetical protein CLAIMM_14788 [Cladophialophora immunda]|nr:hypothetical protein CLAIMM_14788 [Cladophialophora immunda]
MPIEDSKSKDLPPKIVDKRKDETITSTQTDLFLGKAEEKTIKTIIRGSRTRYEKDHTFHRWYDSMIDVNQFTVISEIFPSHIRGEAVCISIGSLLLVDVLWHELQPVASRNMGWKCYLVFAAMGIALTIYLYFCLPETSGVALEELDRIFGDSRMADFTLENRGDVDVISTITPTQDKFADKTNQDTDGKGTERGLESVSEA